MSQTPDTGQTNSNLPSSGCSERSKHGNEPANTDPINMARTLSSTSEPQSEELNTDDRQRYNWETRYEQTAWTHIRRESAYVMIVVVLALSGLMATWHGVLPWLLSSNCIQCEVATLKQYLFIFFGGMLGGGLFGMKYLYKVVARGWWNRDRMVWRYASPFLSAGLAFAAGTFVSAGMLGFSGPKDGSPHAYVALGFLVGYFADQACGKMQEVAETMFGTHTSKRG